MTWKKIFVVGMVPMIISCMGVYISTPQPVDSRDIISFPEKFRGFWIDEEASVIIDKKILKYTRYSEEKIPREKLDSSAYILKNQKIYLLHNEGTELRGGFPYKIKEDTLIFNEIQLLEVELGKGAFLRKLKKDYILNIKQENQWWILILFRKDNTGNILITSLDHRDLEKFRNFDHIYSYYDYKYTLIDFIEANWTQKELLEMIDQGLFSDTIRILGTNGEIRYE